MRLEELRDKVNFLVNFNSAQSDQSFAGPSTDTNKYIDWAINESYREEVRIARRMISRNAFLKTFPMTWSANAETMSIPEEVRGKDIVAIRDDTDQSPGVILSFSDNTGLIDGIYVYDYETWGWDSAPSQDKTLSIYYLATPNEMKNAGDSPELLKPDDHDILTWGAAIILRMSADESAPLKWEARHEDLRWQLHKGIAQGLYTVAINPPPRIRHDDLGIS